MFLNALKNLLLPTRRADGMAGEMQALLDELRMPDAVTMARRGRPTDFSTRPIFSEVRALSSRLSQNYLTSELDWDTALVQLPSLRKMASAVRGMVEVDARHVGVLTTPCQAPSAGDIPEKLALVNGALYELRDQIITAQETMNSGASWGPENQKRLSGAFAKLQQTVRGLFSAVQLAES